jgi:hypothetical protein
MKYWLGDAHFHTACGRPAHCRESPRQRGFTRCLQAAGPIGGTVRPVEPVD